MTVSLKIVFFYHIHKNIKHFASAALIRSAVSVLIIVALVFAGIGAVNVLVPELKETGGIVQTIGTVKTVANTVEQYQQAGGDVEKIVEIYEKSENIDDVIKEFEDKGVDTKPVLDKLGGKEKAEEMIKEFKETGNLPGGLSMDMIEQYMK